MEPDELRELRRHLRPSGVQADLGLELIGQTFPAAAPSGDVFDFAPSPGGIWWWLADVSGAGIEAGARALLTRGVLRGLCTALEPAPPSAVLRAANQAIHPLFPREAFASAVLCHWDPAAHQVTWCGAGHESLHVYRAAERRTETLRCGGVVLGAVRQLDPAVYADQVVTLAPGDALVLTSDGFAELQDPAGAFFGAERLAATITEHADQPAPDLLASLAQVAEAFRGERERADDLTLVIARRPA